MSIENLRSRLRDVQGIEQLTVQFISGRQNYGLAGKLISLDAGASDADVESAIRAAVSSNAVAQLPAGTPVSPTGATAPASPATTGADVLASSISVPVISTAKASTMTTTPGSHALTIKDALENHAKKLDQILQASMATLQATLDDQVDTVQGGTAAVITKVKSHTDDFKAILGQFTNEI